MKVNKMLLWLLLVVVVCVVAPGSSLPEGGEEEVEELPQAEAYRQPMRNNNRQRFIGGGGGMSGGMSGGGGGGGGAVSAASYDLSKTYDSMIRKTSADNRMGNNYNNYNSNSGSRLDMGYSDETRSDHYDTYAASPSEYGGYGSDSGYGLSCASGYVNASAVALLAFLFLLNIVQDVVQQITGGRKKREADEDSDVFSFVYNGGLSALKEGLPEVVLPLMVDLMEASEAPHCLQRPLCDANLQLSVRYGVVGKVVASLLSNVVSKAFSGDDAKKFHLALEASSVGRSGGKCTEMFPSCSRTFQQPSATSNNNVHNNNRDGVKINQPPSRENEQELPHQPLNHNHVD